MIWKAIIRLADAHLAKRKAEFDRVQTPIYDASDVTWESTQLCDVCGWAIYDNKTGEVIASGSGEEAVTLPFTWRNEHAAWRVRMEPGSDNTRSRE